MFGKKRKGDVTNYGDIIINIGGKGFTPPYPGKIGNGSGSIDYVDPPLLYGSSEDEDEYENYENEYVYEDEDE